VLSFASVHKFALHGTSLRAIIRICSSIALHERRPPCYHSHLFINLCLKGVPPCYHSHHHQIVFSRRGTSLRAIIRNCSSIVFHEGHVPPCYHSLFINLRYTKGRPSVLSFTSVHGLRYTKGHVPPCYHSHVHKFALQKGHVPPCYVRICS
jgi:hypothetical protein